MSERRMEPTRAVPKPSILNPGVKLLAKSSIRALITKVNNPKVSRFKGKVKRISTGLIKALTKPIMTAAINADPKSAK